MPVIVSIASQFHVRERRPLVNQRSGPALNLP
jgi:hypothetical protein